MTTIRTSSLSLFWVLASTALLLPGNVLLAQSNTELSCDTSNISFDSQTAVTALAGPNGIRTIAQIVLEDTTPVPDRQFFVGLRHNDETYGETYSGLLAQLPDSTEIIVVVDVDPELVAQSPYDSPADQPAYLFALLWGSLLQQFNLTGNPYNGDQMVVDIPALKGIVSGATSDKVPIESKLYTKSLVRDDDRAVLYNFVLNQLPLVSSASQDDAKQNVRDAVLDWLGEGSSQASRLVVLLRWHMNPLVNDELFSRIADAQVKNSHPTPLMVIDLGQRHESEVIDNGSLYLLPTDLLSFEQGVAYPNPYDLVNWEAYRNSVHFQTSTLVADRISTLRSAMQHRFVVDKSWPAIVSLEDMPDFSLHVETTLGNGQTVSCDHKLRFIQVERPFPFTRGLQFLKSLVTIAAVLTCVSLVYILMQWMPLILVKTRRISSNDK